MTQYDHSDKEDAIVQSAKAKIGDGCTIFIGSDRYPGTVIEVSKSGKQVYIQRDKIGKNGYEQDAEAQHEMFRLRKDGSWHDKGKGTRTLQLGVRDYFIDPHF